jgi:hypothetical protein
MQLLSERWVSLFQAKPEAGMGFHTGNVQLQDDRRFEDVIFTSGYITKVRGHTVVPFEAAEVASIQVTNRRWNWDE